MEQNVGQRANRLDAARQAQRQTTAMLHWNIDVLSQLPPAAGGRDRSVP